MNVRRLVARLCAIGYRIGTVARENASKLTVFHCRVVLICLGLGLLFTISAITAVSLKFEDSNEKSAILTGTDRSRCCLTSTRIQQDICGRRNCTLPCPQQQHFDRSSEPKFNTNDADFRDKPKGFLVETSGSGLLNYRQSCAVESLALINPEMAVYVLFIDVDPANSTVIQSLKNRYPNLHMIRIDMDDYLAGTPLERWYHCTDWRSGPHHTSHLSDALRFLTLFKYGGYYFDLDVIQVRPVTFYRNFVSMESQDRLASCALHADYGHPLMKMAVEDFATNYK